MEIHQQSHSVRISHVANLVQRKARLTWLLDSCLPYPHRSTSTGLMQQSIYVVMSKAKVAPSLLTTLDILDLHVKIYHASNTPNVDDFFSSHSLDDGKQSPRTCDRELTSQRNMEFAELGSIIVSLDVSLGACGSVYCYRSWSSMSPRRKTIAKWP